MAAGEASSKRSRLAEEGGSATAEEPVLYSYWRSTCSWRVRIALHLKGIAFAYRAVNLLKGEQHAGDYLSLNSMHELPTLLIDGLALTQSMSIIQYLDETRPDFAPLLPADAAGRQAVRSLCEIVACDIQPVQNLRVLQRVMEAYSTPEEREAKKLEWARHCVSTGLAGLEAAVAKTAGTYSYGDSVTMADLLLVPQMYNADRFGVDKSAFPTLVRVTKALEALPAFIAAHPSKQPDAVL